MTIYPDKPHSSLDEFHSEVYKRLAPVERLIHKVQYAAWLSKANVSVYNALMDAVEYYRAETKL